VGKVMLSATPGEVLLLAICALLLLALVIKRSP
jgi:hypothetical protein